MPRAFLVHWNKEEVLEKARPLRAAGWSVVCEHGDGEVAFKSIREKPPEVVIIHLSRLPSHGARVAEVLQQTKATHEIPIVFVDGEPDKIAKVQQKIPNATYLQSMHLDKFLQRFMKA
ncbi:response regulator transcription factor [candidate division KSB1 bacterium]|nr:response regulator transcription factor [candidate division KSB1 bacterium]